MASYTHLLVVAMTIGAKWYGHTLMQQVSFRYNFSVVFQARVEREVRGEIELWSKI